MLFSSIVSAVVLQQVQLLTERTKLGLQLTVKTTEKDTNQRVVEEETACYTVYTNTKYYQVFFFVSSANISLHME